MGKSDAVEVTDYGDRDIPVGLRLSAYPLHTDEWRQAFLDRLTQVGYIGLLEAAGHVYDLLFEPKRVHCALVAQLVGVPGAGKLAIYNSLRTFLDDYLYMEPVPPFAPRESLEGWDARVRAKWRKEHEREAQLISSFACILNGEQSNKLTPDVERYASVIAGPWNSPAEMDADPRLTSVVAKDESHTARPSMADADFVDSLVRRLLEDARAVPAGPHQNDELAELVAMWSAEFSPGNPAYAQSWPLPEALSIFLRLRGYGVNTPAEDFDAPVKDLLAQTLNRCLGADERLRDGQINAEQWLFRIETAVEDCQCLFRGDDNSSE